MLYLCSGSCQRILSMIQRIVKALISLTILFFLVWTIFNNGSLVWNKIAAANPIFICLSVFFLGLTYLGGACLWFMILKGFSKKIEFKEVFRIFIVSNFGRFLPGVALHYVARIYLSKSLGLSVPERISAVVLEAYYTLIGGTIVAMLALPIAVRFTALPWLLYLVAVVLLAVIFIAPPRLAFLLTSKIPILGKHIPIVSGEGRASKNHLKLIGISILLFIIYGAALNILIFAFAGGSFNYLSEITGLLSASWVVGFLTPIAPGGLGVSDLSFAFMLQYFYNFTFASFIAVTFRFLLFAAEGIMFLLVLKLSNFDIVNFKKMAMESSDE